MNGVLLYAAVPAAALACALFAGTLRFMRAHMRRRSFRVMAVYFLALWAVMGLYCGLLIRAPGSEPSVIHWMPFEGYRLEDWFGGGGFVMNIAAFAPLGLLLSHLGMKRGRVCALGLTCSLCLEAAQLMTGRGYCDSADVLANTLGAAIGAVLAGKGDRR